MGGPGSGRHWRGDRRTTVEESRKLAIGELSRAGVIVPGMERSAGWQWSRGGKVLASVGLRVDLRDAREDVPGVLTLNYTVRRGEGEPQQYSYHVELATSPLPWGGVRYWFVCPLSRRGGPVCRRRVSALYMPPGAEVFGCRHCYDLGYTSSQESHRFDGLYATLGADLGWSVGDVRGALQGLKERWQEPQKRRGRSRRRA